VSFINFTTPFLQKKLSEHTSSQARAWRRSAKTRTTLKIDELPQGRLPAHPREPLAKEDGPAYPPVLQQVRNNMQKFSHCVVLTRVGNFYELYFEHAEEYAPLLAIKLGKKNTNAGPVPMVRMSNLIVRSVLTSSRPDFHTFKSIDF